MKTRMFAALGVSVTGLTMSACAGNPSALPQALEGEWNCAVTGEDAISFDSVDDDSEYRMALYPGYQYSLSVDGKRWSTIAINPDPSEPPTTANGTLKLNDGTLSFTIEAIEIPYEDPAEFIGLTYYVAGLPETIDEVAQLSGNYDVQRYVPSTGGFTLQEDEDSALMCSLAE